MMKKISYKNNKVSNNSASISEFGDSDYSVSSIRSSRIGSAKKKKSNWDNRSVNSVLTSLSRSSKKRHQPESKELLDFVISVTKNPNSL
jgi:hypothetical protein